jgi:hypothetical protein
MFAARYFPKRYFAGRYFPPVPSSGSSATLAPIADASIASGWTSTASAGSFYTALADASDSTFISAVDAGAGSTSYWTLGTIPSDIGTVTAISVVLRLAWVGGKTPDGRWASARIFKADRSTALTALMTITDTSSITDYTFTPSLSGPVTQADWNGCVLALTSIGPSSATNAVAYKNGVTLTYTPAASGNRRRRTIITGAAC